MANSPTGPSFNAVVSALRTVVGPDFKRDVITHGLIQDLKVGDDGKVSMRLQIPATAAGQRAKIEEAIKHAVIAVSGVKLVELKGADGSAPSGTRAQTQSQGSSSIAGVAHIIAVSSGKGGVGKSTVAVNLATSLAMDGARVGLMDADVYGPNVPTMMGVTDEPKIENGIDGEMFVPPSAHGVKVMSMGFLIKDDQPLVWRGPMLHSVVNQFCHKVNWGQLDYLIVDMPPGTGDVQLSLAQLVPVTGAVLVTTPQEVSLQDVRKAYHMFEKVRIPVMGIVENMSYFKCDSCEKQHSLFGSEGGKNLAKRFNTELLAQLPVVTSVREGGDEGKPVVIREPNSEAALSFRALARKVAASVSASAGDKIDPSQIIQIGKFS